MSAVYPIIIWLKRLNCCKYNK